MSFDRDKTYPGDVSGCAWCGTGCCIMWLFGAGMGLLALHQLPQMF